MFATDNKRVAEFCARIEKYDFDWSQVKHIRDIEPFMEMVHGKEPNRYVVIVPNDKDEFSKPYNAGKNNNDRGRKDGKRFEKGGKGNKFNRDRKDRKGGSGFVEQKKKSTISFGTYLGNSLKDK